MRLYLCLCILTAVTGLSQREEAAKLRQRLPKERLLPPTPELALSLAFQLTRIGGLDEASGRLDLTGRLLLTWTDPQAAWEPRNFGNLTELPVSESDLWTPPLSLAPPGEIIPTSREPSLVEVTSNGSCRLMRSVHLRLYVPPAGPKALYTAHLRFNLQGYHNNRIQLDYWRTPINQHLTLPVLPRNRYRRVSELWAVSEARAAFALSSQRTVVYELILHRKTVAWWEVLGVRMLGVAVALIFAFAFPPGGHLRWLGLLAALLVQATTELLVTSWPLLGSRSLSTSLASSRREVILLSGWALIALETLLAAWLIGYRRWSTRPLSRSTARFLYPLLRLTGQRVLVQRLVQVTPTLKRQASQLSASISGRMPMPPPPSTMPPRPPTVALQLYPDSGMGSTSAESAASARFPRSASNFFSEDRSSDPILHRTNSGSILGTESLRSSPDSPRLYIGQTPPPRPSSLEPKISRGYAHPFCGCLVNRPQPPPELDGRRIFLRRQAVVALDRLCAILLMPLALLFLYYSS